MNSSNSILITHSSKESMTSLSDIITSSSTLNPKLGGDRDRAPLSPPSVGPSSASDGAPYRHISSASSVSSSITSISGNIGAGSQLSHYRLLTSTAAERK